MGIEDGISPEMGMTDEVVKPEQKFHLREVVDFPRDGNPQMQLKGAIVGSKFVEDGGWVYDIEANGETHEDVPEAWVRIDDLGIKGE